MMKHAFTRWGVKTMVALSVGLGAWTSGEAQTLTWLGVLPNYNWSSSALGVSADGRVVVGSARNADYQGRAFRWTAQSGIQDLGTLGGSRSYASAVSADGSVVVGSATNANVRERAFRWVNGVMQDLGTLGGYHSQAYGVSMDGRVVVGWSDNADYRGRAFRWTAQRGMDDLGTLPGGGLSVARGVSADGGVVVGYANNSSQQTRAFRWTVQDGMQDLGLLGGYHSYAYAVSADGSVVVGESQNASYEPRAFRWRQGRGMEDLNQTYAALLTPGSSLHAATAISPDGRYIVGYGFNAATQRREAFLLDTGSRCTAHNGDVDISGCVDDADLLAVLFAFGSTGQNLGREDVNCDGTVDDADLLIVLFNFGSGC